VISDAQLQAVSDAAAEEVLRVIYGDDLQGCSVALDSIADVIRTVFQDHVQHTIDLAELHTKGFQAVQLLATPPAHGNTLSAEELRSLLGERLDSIQQLAVKILSATTTQSEPAGSDQT
jgi:hypothetical protein